MYVQYRYFLWYKYSNDQRRTKLKVYKNTDVYCRNQNTLLEEKVLYRTLKGIWNP